MNDVLLKNQIEMNEKIGGIAETVRRHDVETFLQMVKVLDEQTKALTRMESKQNKDIIQFNDRAEKINKRIDPIEQDYIARQESKKDAYGKIKGIFWEIIKIIAIACVTYVLLKVAPQLKTVI